MTMIETSEKPRTVDDLLQQKRQTTKTVRPSDGFWDASFAPGFARKMMAALGRPRREGRALTIVGWTTPFVFGAIFLVAVAVAYLFSPQRAIARWEASAGQKQYIVDAIPADSVAGKNYVLDHSQNTLTGEPTGGLATYHFTAASAANDNRSDF